MSEERARWVGPVGPLDASIAFVGEAPGADEDREGVPFVGEAGRLYDLCLGAARIPRHTAYITNLVKRRPPGNDITGHFLGGCSKDVAFRLRDRGCLVYEATTSWDSDKVEYYALTERGMEARAELLEELAKTKAKVLVPMGNPAMLALTGAAGIQTRRGAPAFSSEFPERYILPTIHPAASLHGTYLFRYYIQADFQRAKAMTAPTFTLPTRRLITDATFFEIVELLRAYRQEPQLGFDIEMKMASQEILAVSFSPRPDEALAIPFLGRWSATEERVLWEEIAAVLGSEGSIITQNGIFDTFIMEHAKRITIRRKLECTMTAHRIVYPELLSGLDTLASLYTYEPYYKGDGKESRRIGDVQRFLEYSAKDPAVTQEVWQEGIEPLLEADPDHARTYAFTMELHRPLKRMMHEGMRVDNRGIAEARIEALQILRQQQEELDALARPNIEEAAKPLTERLTAAEATLARVMEKRPRISPKTGKALKGEEFVHPLEVRREASKAVTALKHEMAFFLPTYDEELGMEVLLNANSPTQLGWYFYTRTGLAPYRKQRTGAVTVDEYALQRLAKPIASREGFIEAALVLELRERRKHFGTYLNMRMDADGRCRCAYKPTGAKTGRLSSTQTYWDTGGNHQNVPPEFRKAFLADPGKFFFAVDQKGAEWVVVAYDAGDREMIRVVEEGLDPHIHTAFLMTGIPKEVLEIEAEAIGVSTSPAFVENARARLGAAERHALERARFLPRNMSGRQCGKKANHGLNYREGEVTFALTNGISIPEARTIIQLYTQSVYPGVARRWQNIEMQLRADRTLVNCLGRKFIFRAALNDALFRLAYAFIPQSTVVDATNEGLLYLDRYLPRMVPTVQKHDEIMGQYRFADSKLFWGDVERLREAMTPELCYGGRSFRLETELSLGMSWGTLRPVHDLGEAQAHLQTLAATP